MLEGALLRISANGAEPVGLQAKSGAWCGIFSSPAPIINRYHFCARMQCHVREANLERVRFTAEGPDTTLARDLIFFLTAAP